MSAHRVRWTTPVRARRRRARGQQQQELHEAHHHTSDDTVRDLLKRGVNVAVVYWKHLPETDFGGFEVINGDETDLRFADPLGKVVGLKYKPSVADNPQDMKFIRKTQTLVTV